MPGVGVTVGVDRVPLFTVTATVTVASTALLVENALITKVCGPSDTAVLLKLILHLPPEGLHKPPLPAPSGYFMAHDTGRHVSLDRDRPTDRRAVSRR